MEKEKEKEEEKEDERQESAPGSAGVLEQGTIGRQRSSVSHSRFGEKKKFPPSGWVVVVTLRTSGECSWDFSN